ncbi:MAG: CorA family divalent cation transporter [Methanocella sp.]
MKRGLTGRLEDLRERLRGPVDYAFSEDLMTLLAFLIIPTVIFPYLFRFSDVTLALFELLNYLIIAVFIAEYVLKLFVAEDRLEFVRSPWHVLDLVIIALALAELLPFVSTSAGRASPLLRLLRLLRAVTAAGRTIKIPPRVHEKKPAAPKVSMIKVNALGSDGRVTRCATEDEAFRLAAGGGQWIDLQNASEIDLDGISRTLGIPRYVLESRIIQESFPRIDYFRGFTTVFIWDAKLKRDGPGTRDLEVSRHSMLIVCQGTRVVTISTGESELFDSIVAEGLPTDGMAIPVKVLQAIMRKKLRDGEDIVRAIERKVARLEELPAGQEPKTFLADTFFLKREIRIVQNNLWHLRQVMDSLRSKKVALSAITDEDMQLFDVLFEESDFLYETAQNINESLGSLRDLHLNTTTYEMTRVMRFIAVLTCLALIPTIAGGLLGTNLVDVPFPITLPEVGLIVGGLMFIALYSFYKMGWLQ